MPYRGHYVEVPIEEAAISIRKNILGSRWCELAVVQEKLSAEAVIRHVFIAVADPVEAEPQHRIPGGQGGQQQHGRKWRQLSERDGSRAAAQKPSRERQQKQGCNWTDDTNRP